MGRDGSKGLFDRARRLLPGGVNSPVRAYGSVGGEPRFIEKGKGAFIYDVDGGEYVDYVMSWGPLILGHAHPTVLRAVYEAAGKGVSFGAPTEAEIELAEMVKDRMPHVEMLRLVSSGTEAVMTAARLARGFTGRDVLVKFDGCYHGHSDGFLVAAGSGLATGGMPGSAGVPEEVTRKTLSLPYNDLSAVNEVFTERGEDIAAVIVEPIAANMGVVPPADGFLEGLRDVTSRYGALLIFDEVITGFRVARGGAAELSGVNPDLVTLGKILGGGLPIGAVGGRREVMERLAPVGDVYQAGTLSGNPLSVAAGIATLKELNEPLVYERLQAGTEFLARELEGLFAKAGIAARVSRSTGLLTVFFSTILPANFNTVKEINADLFARFFHRLLQQGVYLPPSPYEAWFLSTAHSSPLLERTLQAVEESLKTL